MRPRVLLALLALLVTTFAVDCSGPSTVGEGSLRIVAPAPGSTVADGALSIAVGGAELPPGAQWQYALDGVVVATTPRAQIKLSGVESGEHTLVVTAVNGQGQPTTPALRASASFRFVQLAALSTPDPESIDIRVYPTAAPPAPGQPTPTFVRPPPPQPTNLPAVTFTPTLGGPTARPTTTHTATPTRAVPAATPTPTLTPPPTPTPRPGRIITLTYIGIDADEVGYFSPERDQKQDSHFRVAFILVQPDTVTNMTLYGADREGNRVGPLVWDTSAPQYWTLGVRRSGTRLNLTRGPLNDAVSGQVTYEVYGSVNGSFEDNQVLAVSLTLRSGVEIYGITSIPPAPTPTPRPGSIVDLVWEGLGLGDRVGTSRPEPDGQMDAKLSATFDVGGPQTVTHIMLYSSDQYGRERGSQYWVTVGKLERWVLAVFRNGVQLNPANEPLSDTVNGQVTYELWAGQSGFFHGGGGVYLSITITFSDGSEAYGTLTLPNRI